MLDYPKHANKEGLYQHSVKQISGDNKHKCYFLHIAIFTAGFKGKMTSRISKGSSKYNGTEQYIYL